jgi:F420-0:gamma-glutamyl ligase
VVFITGSSAEMRQRRTEKKMRHIEAVRDEATRAISIKNFYTQIDEASMPRDAE